MLNFSCLRKKKVSIIGAGSVGSLCSLQLARNGIEKYIILDKDKLEIPNVCRHQAGLSSVGKFKADIIKEKILDINPYADVQVFNVDLLNLQKKEKNLIFETDICICSTDSLSANYLVNRECVKRKITAFFIGCHERARTGEIVIYLPENDTPCFYCFNGFRKNIVQERGIFDYSSETDPTRIGALPGLSINIDIITNIASKYILSILQGNKSESYKLLIKPIIPNKNMILINALSYPKEMFSFPLEITQAKTNKQGCPVCLNREEELI